MPALTIWSERHQALTGRYRQRPGVERVGRFRSQDVLIIQVEETYEICDVTYGREKAGTKYTRWRDATWKDFAGIKHMQEGAQNG